MKPCRVLYVLKNFPQMSETYIKTEIEAVQESCDIRIVSTKAANLPAKNHAPYEQFTDLAAIREVIEEFRPDVLHSHWLHSVKILGNLSRLTGVPFTVRAHSFDSIWPEPYSVVERVPFFGAFRNPSHIRRAVDLINGELCLGVLNFPFARSRLERAGIRPDKLFDCYPVVNYRLFHNEEPNGDAIMNVGACIPKKKMEDFLDLALAAPKMRFDLYALGYRDRRVARDCQKPQESGAFQPAVGARRDACSLQTASLADLYRGAPWQCRLASIHRRSAGLRCWGLYGEYPRRPARLCRRGRISLQHIGRGAQNYFATFS